VFEIRTKVGNGYCVFSNTGNGMDWGRFTDANGNYFMVISGSYEATPMQWGSTACFRAQQDGSVFLTKTWSKDNSPKGCGYSIAAKEYPASALSPRTNTLSKARPLLVGDSATVNVLGLEKAFFSVDVDSGVPIQVEIAPMEPLLLSFVAADSTIEWEWYNQSDWPIYVPKKTGTIYLMLRGHPLRPTGLVPARISVRRKED
jgi:hypothetical protein